MEQITDQHWAIIINPKSGKKKFRRQRRYLFLKLKHAQVQFEFAVTKYEGHAILLAKLFAERHFKNFLVLGGDGTTSEVINGVFSACIEDHDRLKVAIIPRGTGNDWARFWGLNKDYQKSIDVFLTCKTQSIDIGRVSYSAEDKVYTHFFINSLGLGLDAEVVRLTHKIKGYIGSFSFLYIVALLIAVFTYRIHKVKIYFSDDEVFEDDMLTMSIANGCYSGGGLKQTPDAVPYDGLFDVMFARRPTLVDVVTALNKLFRGKLQDHKIIHSFQTHKLTITNETNVMMEADGIIIDGQLPCHVDIIPNAIQMVIP